ncbi:hypothetical protein [Dyella sp. 20L07]|uniref:hypothetical protein n=1 Tax=Dyella sp. 20L07 TaxID=3384240 RepID=UPI003D271CFE
MKGSYAIQRRAASLISLISLWCARKHLGLCRVDADPLALTLVKVVAAAKHGLGVRRLMASHSREIT